MKYPEEVREWHDYEFVSNAETRLQPNEENFRSDNYTHLNIEGEGLLLGVKADPDEDVRVEFDSTVINLRFRIDDNGQPGFPIPFEEYVIVRSESGRNVETNALVI